MAVTMLRRQAANAVVPVFVARGGGTGRLPAEVAADRRLRVVTTPRHATVLLAAGRFPGSMGDCLDRLHDQLPRPRRTVWWTASTERDPPTCSPDPVVVTSGDPADAIITAHRQVLLGEVEPDPDALADDPPNPFEGRGDHGQGGEGMMGGVPHGRPMAGTVDDRDGLALDGLSMVVGPFLPGFPNGLQAEVTLAGGVVREAKLRVLDLGAGPALDRVDRSGAPGAPRHQLRWLSDALRLAGLTGLAVRAARLAAGDPSPAGLATLTRRIRRSGLGATWAGVGVLDGEDARDRLEQHLIAEPPARSSDTEPSLEEVAEVLVGQDWGDAMITIASLDLSTERAALAAADAG